MILTYREEPNGDYSILKDGKIAFKITDGDANTSWWALTLCHAINKTTSEYKEFLEKELG